MRATSLPSKDLACLQLRAAVPYSCPGTPLHPRTPVPAVPRAAPHPAPGSDPTPGPAVPLLWVLPAAHRLAGQQLTSWLQASPECCGLGKRQGRRVVLGMGGGAAGTFALGHRDLRPQQHRHSSWGLSTPVSASSLGKVPREGSSQPGGSSGSDGQRDGWANP